MKLHTLVTFKPIKLGKVCFGHMFDHIYMTWAIAYSTGIVIFNLPMTFTIEKCERDIENIKSLISHFNLIRILRINSPFRGHHNDLSYTAN